MKEFSAFVALFLCGISTAAFARPSVPFEMPIQNYHYVSHGIGRGARPDPSDMVALRDAGFKTLINLENDEKAIADEALWAKMVGVEMISVPFSALRTPRDEDVEHVLSLMADPSRQPVFIHCHHGRDRTGLLVGLYRVLTERWHSPVAYSEMLEIGFRPIFYKLRRYFEKRTEPCILALVHRR